MADEIDKSAGAILCPDRIVFETLNKGAFGYYVTDNVTILPLECLEKEIGSFAKKHLNDSVFLPVTPESRKIIWANYKKKAKFKTEKSLYENGKYVSIKYNGKTISLNSYQAKLKDKVFFGNPSSIVNLNDKISDEEFGKEIKLAWSKCKFV